MLLAVDPRETLDLALRNLLAADDLLDGHPSLDGCVRILKLIHSENRKDLVLLPHGVRSGLTIQS